jgi:CRISPR-associated protein Cas5d
MAETKSNHTVSVKVSAPLACFTRPEAKVERVSYLCITPSAARGILESILWKPEFVWFVHTITVLKPIRFASIRRNEIQDTIPIRGPAGVLKWMENNLTYTPYYTDSRGRKSPHGDNGVQRNTLALRDVSYIITANPILTPKAYLPSTRLLDRDEPVAPNTVEKYVAMFTRRVKKGQCFQQPYLGLREFVAAFDVARDDDKPDPQDPTLRADNYALGRMFYDYDYRKGESRSALFAAAFLENGVLNARKMHETATTEVL